MWDRAGVNGVDAFISEVTCLEGETGGKLEVGECEYRDRGCCGKVRRGVKHYDT